MLILSSVNGFVRDPTDEELVPGFMILEAGCTPGDAWLLIENCNGDLKWLVSSAYSPCTIDSDYSQPKILGGDVVITMEAVTVDNSHTRRAR
jgi:hypothetical protein